jgi:VWA domain-containing protein/HEAT repeat protein
VRSGMTAAALLLLAVAALAGPPSFAGRLRSSDDAVRLEALEELASLPPAEVPARAKSVVPHIRKLLRKDPAPKVRGTAGIVLALAAGEGAVDPLIDSLIAERDPVVEMMLRPAFAGLPPEAARKALAAVARDENDPRSAALAAECLGWLGDRAGADDLYALLLGARQWAVLAGTCLGVRRQRDVRFPPLLVQRLRHPDPCVRSVAREALVDLCGVDHGVSQEKWEAWWEEVGEGYSFPDGKKPVPGAAGGEGPRSGSTSDAKSGGRRTFARFFGIEVAGRRVAFVIDYSQSMWGPRREKSQGELLDAVKGLPTDRAFTVILFNGKVWWHKQAPVPARPQEKLDLEVYLPEQETKNYTNIYDAMDQALGLMGEGSRPRDPAPGLDEIVLLSDGEPNRGKLRQPDQILVALEAMTAGRIPIHTVSLNDDKEPSTLLKDLAARTGGRYVAHPIPK